MSPLNSLTALDPSLAALHGTSASAGTQHGRLRPQEETKKAAAMLEALFLRQMLKEMRKTVPDGGIFGKTNGHETFEQMLDGAYADELSKNGGIGLKELLLQQFDGVAARAKVSPAHAARTFQAIAAVNAQDVTERRTAAVERPAPTRRAQQVRTLDTHPVLDGVAFEAPARPEPVRLRDNDPWFAPPVQGVTPAAHANCSVFQATAGAGVVAARSGTVVASDSSGIAVDHGQGLVTRYQGLGSVEAQVGDLVLRGQTIGTVGQTGQVELSATRGTRPLHGADLVSSLRNVE